MIKIESHVRRQGRSLYLLLPVVLTDNLRLRDGESVEIFPLDNGFNVSTGRKKR